MAEWWMQSGTTSTANTGTPVIAGTTGEGGIQSCSIDRTMLKRYTLTACELALTAVQSENASWNLQTRSVVVPIPIDPAAGAGYGSTSLALWTPYTAISTRSVRVHPHTAWSLTTCGEEIHLWTTGGDTVGQYCTSSTAFCLTATGGYTFPDTNVDVAAGDTIRIGLVNLAACSNVGLGAIQIDYWTTG